MRIGLDHKYLESQKLSQTWVKEILHTSKESVMVG